MFVDVPVLVVVSVSRTFCRRRLIISHSKTALNPTAITAVRDTDKPATSPRDSSFSAGCVSASITQV